MLRPAAAQRAAWIQIEAQPSLRAAQDRARYFSERLEDVHGFALGGGWYGIMVGPYSRADAERALRLYKAEGRIPGDSFLYQGAALGAQFWPVGRTPATARAATPTPAATSTPQPQATALPNETPAQARRSERLLSAQERRALQIALRAAGFYNSTIDGVFGRGTRAAMADWQAARGYEPTGILTTAQRKALMDEYNAPLISVGMQRVLDPQAGIEIAMPTREVKFSRYEPPFCPL
ncbi:peptidoglycan-binding domain-containing protein [Jhaorihella thermophila]